MINDPVIRYVVIFLGIALLLCVGGIIYLSVDHENTPQVLDTLAFSLGSGLLGLAVNSRQP